MYAVLSTAYIKIIILCALCASAVNLKFGDPFRCTKPQGGGAAPIWLTTMPLWNVPRPSGSSNEHLEPF